MRITRSVIGKTSHSKERSNERRQTSVEAEDKTHFTSFEYNKTDISAEVTVEKTPKVRFNK